MQVVAGINLKSIKPRVWDSNSPYYLPQLQAVMISYADFYKNAKRRREAMEKGLHESLGIPKKVKIYLDNGSFYFATHDGTVPKEEYEEFVKAAKPDWYPIPQDFIPIPKMSKKEQEKCFRLTMKMNLSYSKKASYVPVIHISQLLDEYIDKVKNNKYLLAKPSIALGGIVPNLLRASKAISHEKILERLIQVREEFKDKKLHIFGIGGTATFHVAALLGINSVDSSGWRNRAARGLIQLPGTGDRIVAPLGKWRGRHISESELIKLKEFPSPVYKKFGLEGLQANRSIGFYNRAAHNLWVLLEEARLIQEHLLCGDYQQWYKQHLDNTIYRRLIDRIMLERDL